MLFGFVKHIHVLKTGVHLVCFHRFLFTGSGTFAGVQLFSVLRFSFAEKNVYWRIYYLCPQMFICSRQRNMYWCTSGLPQRCLFVEKKEHVLLHRAGHSPRCLFAADKGKHTVLKVVSICIYIFFFLQAKEHILVYNRSLSTDFYPYFSKSRHHFFN
jgi:hypothetical protein